MTKILVTGASGFVGRALCATLPQAGYEVLAAVRQSIPEYSVPQVIVESGAASTSWRKALQGVDTIIHLAARVHVMRASEKDALLKYREINVQGTEHLARSAAATGVKRFVFVSSIKVNGEKTAGRQSYSEQDTPAPQDPYGISKWEAEQALYRVAKETGLEVVIVRPPLVYGAGVKGNFAQMMWAVARAIPLPLASARNQRDLVYAGNLVDALITCATHPAAAGQTYLVSDGESVSTPDLLRHLAKALGKHCFVFPFPIYIMRFLAVLLGKSAAVDRLTQSLMIDSSKIRRELGWQPPYSMEQGLKATAEWYLHNQARASKWPPHKNKRDITCASSDMK